MIAKAAYTGAKTETLENKATYRAPRLVALGTAVDILLATATFSTPSLATGGRTSGKLAPAESASGSEIVADSDGCDMLVLIALRFYSYLAERAYGTALLGSQRRHCRWFAATRRRCPKQGEA